MSSFPSSDFGQLALWAALLGTLFIASISIAYMRSKKLHDFLVVDDCVTVRTGDAAVKVQIYRVYKKLKNPRRLFDRSGYRVASDDEVLVLGQKNVYTDNLVRRWEKTSLLEVGSRVALVNKSTENKRQPRAAIVPSPP